MAAASEMAKALEQMNIHLENDLDEPLRMGIGIHSGPAIVGEMGYGQATSITAIGDSVNTASRLETMTKEFKVQLVVSKQAADNAGVDMTEYAQHNVVVRGRREPLAIYVVNNASTLPQGES